MATDVVGLRNCTKRAPDKMVAENENVAPPHREIGDCDDGSIPNAPRRSPAGGYSAPLSKPKSKSEKSDGFYEKLCKVNEPTGLSLIFNFRDTSLDLHLFYEKVTERGGYHQVTRDGSWGEVASALNIKSAVPMSPTQLQNLYASLLYQFEQTYHYRTPGKLIEASSRQATPIGHSSGNGDYSSCSPGKRKHFDSSSNSSAVHYSYDDSPSKKTESNKNSGQTCTVPSTEEQKLTLQSSVKEKEMKKDPNTPLGPRTGYQIFVKIECDRLKRIHGDTSSGQLRDMAIEAWRNLSENDKKPYVEASRKDKERSIREMAAYNQCKIQKHAKIQNLSRNKCPKVIDFALAPEKDEDYHHIISELEAGNKCQNMYNGTTQKVIDFAKPLQTDGDYHVTLKTDAGNKCQITAQEVINFAKPLQTDGDYHVTLEPDAETRYISDESMVELAIGMMKNARPNDPIFQMNWDEYCGSLDIPG